MLSTEQEVRTGDISRVSFYIHGPSRNMSEVHIKTDKERG